LGLVLLGFRFALLGSLCALALGYVLGGMAGVLLRGLYVQKILIKSTCALDEWRTLIVKFQTISQAFK